jgi:uncharacterized membrane protein
MSMDAHVQGRFAPSLLVMPLVRLMLRAAAAGMAPRLAEYGLDDQFATDLNAELQPGGSAIVLVAPRPLRDEVLASITRFGGTVLRTSVALDTDLLQLIDDAASQRRGQPSEPTASA